MEPKDDSVPKVIGDLLGESVREDALLSIGMSREGIRPLASSDEQLWEVPLDTPGQVCDLEFSQDAVLTPALLFIEGEDGLLRPVSMIAIRRVRNLLGVLVPIGLTRPTPDLVRRFAAFLTTYFR